MPMDDLVLIGDGDGGWCGTIIGIGSIIIIVIGIIGCVFDWG